MFSVLGRLAHRASRSGAQCFCRDESGAVAIIFALTTVIMFSLVGGAIDYGRAVHARYQIQEAVDSAVLAAARVWQTENDINLAQEKGLMHYNNNKPLTFSSQVSKFTPDFTANTISMEAEGVVPTPFLSLVRYEGYTVGAHAQARLDVGQNAGQSVEVSLMLDVTGSMAGSKIADLKLAAKDFIDIVVWQDQSEYTSKVAIVPFANTVNVGTTALANNVRGNLRTGSCLTSGSPCVSILTDLLAGLLPWVFGTPPTWYRFPRPNSSTNYNTYKISDRCVTERTGSAAYNDDAPNASSKKVGPAFLPGVVWPSDSGTKAPCGTGGIVVDVNDNEVNTVQPLSNDKDMLKRRVDKLRDGGGTAGHLGTAWAWYMLSPNWAYLWPSANQPKAYGAEKLQKYAILMTDGEYNTMYCNGAPAKNSSGAAINCNATNGQSYEQARTLCTNMKAKGITVYTVGFQLTGGTGSTSYQTLQQCASSPDKFFNAEDGTELRLSFRAIALEVAKLSLSQ